VTKQVLAATNLERGEKMNHYLCIFVVIIGTTLGYVVGNGISAQSCKPCQTKQICQCDEDCQCCASCSCSHGEI